MASQKTSYSIKRGALYYKVKNKVSSMRMYKFIILAITIGGFVFSSSWSNTTQFVEKTNPEKNQYCWAEDTSDDDNKLERRRRGKGQKGRRRGGSGLR